MFGPHWRGDQSLSENSPTQVPLPGDYADAIHKICYIINCRDDLVPQQLTAEEVLKIAIEVDTCDLKDALEDASVGWLKPRAHEKIEETVDLLAAAFLLDNTEAFKAHTVALIFHYTRPYKDFLDDDTIRDIIPSGVFGT